LSNADGNAGVVSGLLVTGELLGAASETVGMETVVTLVVLGVKTPAE